MKEFGIERWEGRALCSRCEEVLPAVHVEIPVGEYTAVNVAPGINHPKRTIDFDLCDRCLRDLCWALLKA